MRVPYARAENREHMNSRPYVQSIVPMSAPKQPSTDVIDINGEADHLHCCRPSCGKSLMVGERRKRVRFGAETRDSRTGRVYRICRKCWRKERAK